jgi:hypothetical protein
MKATPAHLNIPIGTNLTPIAPRATWVDLVRCKAWMLPANLPDHSSAEAVTAERSGAWDGPTLLAAPAVRTYAYWPTGAENAMLRTALCTALCKKFAMVAPDSLTVSPSRVCVAVHSVEIAMSSVYRLQHLTRFLQDLLQHCKTSIVAGCRCRISLHIFYVTL